MEKYLNKIMIVDGSYILHRSLKTPDLAELMTTTGIMSGGVFGFLQILQAEMKKFPAYFPIVCWDKGLSKRRTTLYSDYKANRKRLEADDLLAKGLQAEQDNYLIEYRKQRNDLIEILKAFGIPSLLISGWEGDDLQYLISRVCNEGLILSDDRDMIQLLSPTIKVRRSLRKELLEYGTVEDELKYPQFLIAKSITGDKSDNIPKVAQGVGDKAADQIANYIGDIENLRKQKIKLEELTNDETQKNAIKTKAQKILDNWEQYKINYQLINLKFVEFPVGFEEMIKQLILSTINKSNILKAYSLIGKYEMSTIYPDQIINLIANSSINALIKEKT